MQSIVPDSRLCTVLIESVMYTVCSTFAIVLHLEDESRAACNWASMPVAAGLGLTRTGLVASKIGCKKVTVIQSNPYWMQHDLAPGGDEELEQDRTL